MSLLSTLKSNTVSAGQNILAKTAQNARASLSSSLRSNVPSYAVNLTRSNPASSNVVLAQVTSGDAAKGRIMPWAGDSTGSNWIPSRRRTFAVKDSLISTRDNLVAQGFTSNQAAAILSTAQKNADNLGTSFDTELQAILGTIEDKGWLPMAKKAVSTASSVLDQIALANAPASTETSKSIPTTYLAIGGVAILALLLLRK